MAGKRSMEAKQREAVGFILDVDGEKEVVLVFGLHLGLVFCPRKTMDKSVWDSAMPGQWMTMTVRKIFTGFGINDFHRKAVKAQLTTDPPLTVWEKHPERHPMESMWMGKVGGVVGFVSGSSGVAWSPILGRIEIPKKLAGSLKPLEEVEGVVHIHPLFRLTDAKDPLSPQKAASWIFYTLGSRLRPDVTPRVLAGRIPHFKLFSAAGIKSLADGERGVAQSEETDIHFRCSDFCPRYGERQRPEVGSLWTILAMQRRGKWRAVSFVRRADKVCEKTCQKSRNACLWVKGFAGSCKFQKEEGSEEWRSRVEGGWSRGGKTETGQEIAEREALSITPLLSQDSPEPVPLPDEQAKELELLRNRVKVLESETLRYKDHLALVSQEKSDMETRMEKAEREKEEVKKKGWEERHQLRQRIIQLEDANRQLHNHKREMEEESRKECREAGSQAEASEERNLIEKIYNHEDIFPFICQSPDLVKDFVHVIKLNSKKN